MVTNGPPSIGQLTICGSWLMRVVPCRMGALRFVFHGRADTAVAATPVYRKAFFSTRIGSDFTSTNTLILSSVSRNMKRERSSVPKRLDTAGNGLPFTFSNSKAGPCASYTRMWMAAISKWGSTSCRIRTRWPWCSRSLMHSARLRYPIVIVLSLRKYRLIPPDHLAQDPVRLQPCPLVVYVAGGHQLIHTRFVEKSPKLPGQAFRAADKCTRRHLLNRLLDFRGPIRLHRGDRWLKGPTGVGNDTKEHAIHAGGQYVRFLVGVGCDDVHACQYIGLVEFVRRFEVLPIDGNCPAELCRCKMRGECVR